MSIETKKDYYDAIRGYKYINCPVLSGLNKTQLGELVNKFDLSVDPTGERKRRTGRGLGRRWKVSNRTKTTWKPKKERTVDVRGMDMRFTGLLDKTKPVQEKRRDVEDAGAMGVKDMKAWIERQEKRKKGKGKRRKLNIT